MYVDIFASNNTNSILAIPRIRPGPEPRSLLLTSSSSVTAKGYVAAVFLSYEDASSYIAQ